MAGMRDVAQRAGVSLSTVSAVLNGSKNTSLEIARRVERAIAEMDYELPQKKKNDKKVIAVLLPVITSSFFTNVLSGIESAVAQSEYTVLFGDSEFDFSKELQFINTIKKQSLCGFIIDTVCPVGKESEYFKLLKKNFINKSIPVVFLERSIEDSGFFFVNLDHYRNAFMAIEHLIRQNHTRIAHISGYPGNHVTVQRINGYKAALEENGIGFDETLISAGDFSPNSGYLAMKKLMSIRSDFTAVFSANDQMAIGAIKAIKSYGKSVPDDIAVIGIDNIAMSSIVTPALSTINVPTYQMGHVAAKTIMDMREGQNCQKTFQLESNLIVRQSTDPFANSEWELFGW